jgi:hypothetical protein
MKLQISEIHSPHIYSLNYKVSVTRITYLLLSVVTDLFPMKRKCRELLSEKETDGNINGYLYRRAGKFLFKSFNVFYFHIHGGDEI